MTHSVTRSSRRRFLQQATSLGTAAYSLALFESFAQKARAQATNLPVADKLLFVISAAGGASVVDSFFAVKNTESANANELLVHDPAFITEDAGTGLRALDLPANFHSLLGGFIVGNGYLQSTFLNKYKDDMVVMTLEGTSVNHAVAQKRSMNGFGANKDRTLLETVAEAVGQNLILPNVNMTGGGYLEEGQDATLASFARQEVVSNAQFFALSTDGLRGMLRAPGAGISAAPQESDGTLARARSLMARARGVRNALDDASVFGQTFQCSPLRQRLLARRNGVNLSMEAESLITNLMLIAENDLPDILNLPPLSTYGLAPSPETERVRTTFDPVGLPGLDPGTRIFIDGFLAQACLAFLLARFGLTSSVAFGPQLIADPNTLNVNPPLSFDFSHQGHVATQSIMWSRVLDVTDKLITLLKATDIGGGQTMWDRSCVYIATDFGRDKRRTTPGQPLDAANPVSTGHHLNNGVLLLSPRLKPGRYGGIDTSTLETFGFDRTTGAPAPGTKMREQDVFSAVCHGLDVDYPGRIPLPCLIP